MKKMFAVALIGLFSSCITVYHYHKPPDFSVCPTWGDVIDGYVNADTSFSGPSVQAAIEAAGTVERFTGELFIGGEGRIYLPYQWRDSSSFNSGNTRDILRKLER